MPPAPIPATEAARLRALRRLAVLDTAPEERYSQLCETVSSMLGVPLSLLSLVDADRQWFKANVGLEVSETPREVSFCAYQILQNEPLVIADATLDPRFADNPLVTGDSHVRAYAGAPVVSPDGSALGSLCAVDVVPRDFTCEQVALISALAGQASALLELRQTQLHYRASMAASAVVMVHLDGEGLVLSLSENWVALTGQPTEPLGGAPFAELISPADRGALGEVLAGGGEREVRLTRADGGEVWAALRLQPLCDEEGKTIGHVGSLRDLTEWHLREVETRHAQKLEALGRLSAGLAHEINTPIQFVGDNTRFLADAYDSMLDLVGTYRSVLYETEPMSWEERRQRTTAAEERADLAWLEQEVPGAVRQSLEGVDRVATLVRAMKSFSYKDQDLPVAADLNEALRTAVTVARNETKYVADVALRLGEIPSVRCHVGDLNRVFLNLLVNAADAVAETGRRGRIEVSTSCEGEDVLITVSDDGPGVPEHLRDRVFEPFFTTKGVGRGTGQGLALARTVVSDRHGGRVELHDRPGGGSHLRAPPSGGGPAVRRGPDRLVTTVLFVDDEARVLEGLRRGLRPQRARWSMLFAGSGDEAVEVLQRQPVDVVVSDMRMPGMDGATLLGRVRSHQPGAARVILSGHSEREATLRAAVVAHRFLHKPCDLDVLTGVVDAVARPRTPDPDRVAGMLAALAAGPASDEAAHRLQELMTAPGSPLAAVAEAVAADLAQLSTVLHLASGFTFGGSAPVNADQQGSLLGLTCLRSLLDHVQMFWPYPDGGGGPADLALPAVSARAVAAAQLAALVVGNGSPDLRQHAALAALLRDVGRLACLLGETDALDADLAECARSGRGLEKVERSRRGYLRVELGAALVSAWGLPDPVADALRRVSLPYLGGPVGAGHAARAARLLLQDTPLREVAVGVDPGELHALITAFGGDEAALARAARELGRVL